MQLCRALLICLAIIVPCNYLSGCARSADTENVEADTETSDLEAWRNIEIISLNKEAARANFYGFSDEGVAAVGDKSASPYFQSLNGEWAFRWSPRPAARPSSFYEMNFAVNEWDRITVPSVWEREGYGYPVYANIEYPYNAEPFNTPTDEQNHVGSYVREFTIPSTWRDRRVYIQFGAVSASMTLWVNGKKVGYNQGSRTPAEFDISDYVEQGRNKLAVEVMRWSDGSWLENQDSWSLSGIFRDVDLYARPQTHIRDFFAKATLGSSYKDGILTLSVEGRSNTTSQDQWFLDYQVSRDEHIFLEGREGSINDGASLSFEAAGQIRNVKPWSAEQPNLYDLTLRLKNPSGAVVEIISQKIGFRSIELKNGQVLINGYPIKFRGVNMHEIHPETGYVVDEETMRRDFRLLKAGNFNAVRTSHYPQAPIFYNLADEYGIYVVDEANLETHLYRYNEDLAPARKPEWAAQMLDRTVRMIERDKNHASIIFWSPGNETGPGVNITAIYNWAKERDPTRLFQYADDTRTEGGNFSELENRQFGKSSDILGAFYASPWKLEEYAQEYGNQPWIMMEYWHSMGNSLGNGEAYWDTIYKHPVLQGGFIWDWVDQGLAEVDDAGRAFYGQGGDYGPESAPSSNNFLHNGVVFPDRRPKPAYWNVKKAYQPAKFIPVDLLNGLIEVENRHHFTNMSKFFIDWSVYEDGKLLQSGETKVGDIAPGARGRVALQGLASITPTAGAEYFLILQLRRTDWPEVFDGLFNEDHVVADEQFTLPIFAKTSVLANKKQTLSKGNMTVTQTDEDIIVSGTEFNVRFDKNSGFLTSYIFKEKYLIRDALRPNFWRALTDNDYGFAPHTWDFDWRDAVREAHVVEFTAPDTADQSSDFQLNTTLALKSRTGEKLGHVSLRYVVYSNGVVKISMKFDRHKDRRPPPRVGMRMALPKALQGLTWYGRGPYENYIDRKWASYIGAYKSDVASQYVPYLRPQENGYKTDTRWMALKGDQGEGILFVGREPFGFSTLPNPLEDFEASDEVWAKASDADRLKPTMHLNDLPQGRDGVFVHLDAIQAGVGGDNSWAKRTHNAFIPRELSYHYSFYLRGLTDEDTDLAALARSIRDIPDIE